MRQRYCIRRAIALCTVLIVLVSSAACTPGHDGTKVIGFLRAGQLWTIDPDGANAFAITKQGASVVGYAWSPDHHIVAFRALDKNYASSSQSSSLRQEPTSGQFADAPGSLNTIGVDGGTAITIVFSNADVSYSTPYWNNDGNRLLYRQTPINFSANPLGANWWIAQNDQPGGIATKFFPSTYSLPSFSPITGVNTSPLVIGNSLRGVFTTDIAGQQLQVRTSRLNDHPLPASLERILWRPGTHNSSPAFLYAIESDQGTTDTTNQAGQKGQTPTVQLRKTDLDGNSKTLATCSCTQFSWSPDGNKILYTEGSRYTIIDVTTNTSYSYQSEIAAVPYWSPDSHYLLLNGRHRLTLINVQSHQMTTLLSDGQSTNTESDPLPTSTTAQLQPIENSLWAANSQQFVFASNQRLHWLNSQLHTPGLYVATLNAQGTIEESPTLIQQGQDITQAGWTYQDLNTSFLF